MGGFGGFDDVDDSWNGADFAAEGEFASEKGIIDFGLKELIGEYKYGNGDGEI